MIKRLKKVGNGYALGIDRALMEAMNISPETPLMLTLSGGSLTIAPANVGFSAEEIDEFFVAIRPEYDGMLQRLAE
jgi:antitoxin component of MazEF toxin-antitoxin module